MNTDNNNNNSTSGNGNRGKFSDRLKKIRRDRLKLRKGKIIKEENEEEIFLKRGSRNIIKVFLAIPSVVYSAVKSDKEIVKNRESIERGKKNNISNNIVEKDIMVESNNINRLDTDDLDINHYETVDLEIDSFEPTTDALDIDELEQTNEDFTNIDDFELTKENNKIKVNKIREMDVALLKRERELALEEQKNIVQTKEVARVVDVEENKSNESDKEHRINKLQKEILDLIRKKLVKNINELEVLQSELYLLKEVNGEDIYLKECQEDIKEIKKLLSKINSLKEKYDYLKDNVDFEYMLEYSDDTLIDKIIELKDLCSNVEVKYIVDNYKILEEYKFLYLKIDKLQEDTIKYDEFKKAEEGELKKRDIDFDKLKNDIYNVDKENERYNNFVSEQERLLQDLDTKISNIDAHEEVTYRLKGFNKLLVNSFKYLGLMLASPLKGLIPGIATQTVITKNVIHNLYNNLNWEENRKMVYEAIDYSSSISMAVNNLDNTLSLVNSTLEEIVELKSKYEKEFSKYQSSFSGYRDAIKKINKMENAVLGSKIKIEIMQAKMKEKERQNKAKMKKVKKLNDSSMNS